MRQRFAARRRIHITGTLALACLFCLLARASSAAQGPDLTLTGTVKGAQNHSYLQVPFRVPAGVKRVTLTFEYTGRDQHTALDLGVLDPAGLRCWSGGSKSTLTIGLSDATPSCLPGPVPAGMWNVLIGVPNIRSQVISHYTIQVFFARTGLVADEPAVLLTPLRSGPAWYRGDLHMHTGHSDASCPSQTGKLVPCPLVFTVEAAARRGLDFIAITDHNATSHYDAMRELQPYFDKLLLIPGREITTFYGHINLLGTTDYLDFRVGSKTVPEMNTFLRRAREAGAFVSINHPGVPSGEACMGCGWAPAQPADFHLIGGVEAVNGGSEREGLSGIPFWDKELDAGYRLTGIGGSDNHNFTTPADQPSAVGNPTTVVYADNLSVPAILDGIRAGHVFIDVTASNDRLLELDGNSGSATAHMGDGLTAAKSATVNFEIHAVAASSGKAELLEDGRTPLSLTPGSGAPGQSYHAEWTSDGERHRFRAQVSGPDGKLWLLGNPIYVNWEAARPAQ